MRINPLLAPLVAVLALPFALGLASTASLTAHRPLVGPGGGPGPKPQCKTCTVDIQLPKQQSIPDPACGSATNGTYQYILQTGTCQRYQCANGFYYTFGGWTTTSTCVATQQSATPCPTSTCSP